MLTRPSLIAMLTVVMMLWTGAAGVRADEVTLNGRTFTLPRGFTLEIAAAPPLVNRPIVADFDEQGRLYVADSSGSNDKVEKQLAEKPHRIVRLEDTDGDGKFDRRTVFADQMMFPEGAMWMDGSLYVAAPPSIWKLTDTDGDGVADSRVEWFKGKTLTGCANDLHGPYRGRDGWIYWCKGAFAKQTYATPGKPDLVTRAAHIFRARPDGSGVEPVMTGGMDNPVDVVFTEGGERIFTTTFLQHPGDGKRDGLIHAIYGGVYGKIHDVIDGHARTSPDVMPVLAHLGAAAPCGLLAYESDTTGSVPEGSLFACLFNMSKVTRHSLRKSGATFAATTEDFLVSPDRDFHPTDVLEDADGSLLVLDTGGWYKLCCPTSQLPKPDVLGAIYRIRPIGEWSIPDPRGLKLDWTTTNTDDLMRRVNDTRPAVRRRVIEALSRLGIDSVPVLERALREPLPPRYAENAVWTATRIDEPGARLVAHMALDSDDPTVRQAALHSISLWRDKTAVAGLIKVLGVDKDQLETLLRRHAFDPLLSSHISHNQRAAAEGLGRIGDKSAVPTLLEVAGHEATDRTLEHSCIYALIEIADAEGTAAGLQSANPRTRRAALVALDQMSGGGLEPAQVVPFLAANDRATRETASWIVGRHPHWAGPLVGFLRDRLVAAKLSEAEQGELVDLLARFAREKPVEELLAETLRDRKASDRSRRIALRAMARSSVKGVPQDWVNVLADAVAKSELVGDAVAAARSLPITKNHTKDLAAALLKVGGNAQASAAQRLDALSAVPGGLSEPNPALFAFLRSQLHPAGPIATRMAAASILSRAKLSEEQHVELLENIRAAGPLELDKLLAAYESTRDEELGLKLIAALKGAKSVASLRVETLKPRLDKLGDRVKSEAEGLYASLNVDAATQKAKLESLLPTLVNGDIRRGQAVFNGAKAACLTCHAVGYLGGKLGPDLTKIGQVRTDRDLLEAILFPSLSFVRSYEPITIATKEGKVVTGVLKADASDEVALGTTANEVVTIPRSEIEEMRPGSVSVMPAGLDQQLTRQELADLLAFLKSRK